MDPQPDTPFTADIALPGGALTAYDDHYTRRLSAMRGYFGDIESYEHLLAADDIALYEVYEVLRPEKPGELLHGTAILHPGKVGDEYFKTKGHFHAVLDTAEVYYVLQGEGAMVMQTPEGEWAVELLRAARVLYVPPGWASTLPQTHRNPGRRRPASHAPGAPTTREAAGRSTTATSA